MATRGHDDQDTTPPRPARHREGDDVSGRKDPPTKEQEEREINTPGDGAGPDPTPDGDADPGVG